MTSKKADRKESYLKMLKLLLQNKNECTYKVLVSLAADERLFIFTEYLGASALTKAEKKMKKLLILPLVLMPFQTLSATDERYLDITYFGKATHKPFMQDESRLNNDLNMLSVAYRNEDHGVELTTFRNSYFNRSVAVSYVEYWHPAKYLETSIHVGGVTGYPKTPVLFATSVAYTQSDVFVPKVTWFGQAFMLSLSFKYKF